MTTEAFNEVFSKVVDTVRAASALASQDVKFHASVDKDLKTSFEASSQELMLLANDIINLSGNSPPVEFGESFANSANSWKKVSSVLDYYFEKADTLMDVMKKGDRSEPQLLGGLDEPDVDFIVKDKPQLNFRFLLDNSDSRPFKPRIESKPHAITSFEEAMVPIDKGSTPYYPHPYIDEIMKQPYPESILQKKQPQPSTDWATTDAIWVDNNESLLAMLRDLKASSELAVDLEHHDLRSYYGITCLMQISNRNQDWIIDTLALRDELVILNEVFCDPSIIKVFHGANMDIIWLQRDLGLYIVSLFDTYFASKLLGFSKFSLAFLLEKFANFQTSKKYQLADWRIRPIPSVMMKYARADTHFLLNIFDHLRNMLLEKGNLQEVLHSSRKVACRRFEYSSFRTEQAADASSAFDDREGSKWLMSQYNIPLEKRNLAEEIYNWRDRMARDNDESNRYVMPNHIFLNILNLPASTTLSELKDSIPKKCTLLKDNAETLLQMIKSYDFDSEQSHSSFQPQPHSTAIDVSAARKLEASFSSLKESLPHNQELLHTVSRVLPFNFATGDFSVKFSFDDGPSTVTLNEYEARSREIDELASHNIQTSSLRGIPTPPDSAPSQQADIHDKNESSDTPEVVEKTPSIVTLSKKKRSIKQISKQKSQAEEGPVFDYESNDVKILEGKGTLEKRKRSFEPYNRTTSSGPAPFKGRKLNPTGKSTSFIRKNK